MVCLAKGGYGAGAVGVGTLSVFHDATGLQAPYEYDWTGFYVGGIIGVATGLSNWTVSPLSGAAPISGSFSPYRSPNAFSESGSWQEGVQGG